MSGGDRRYLIALTAAGACVLAVVAVHLFLPAGAVYDVTGHPIGRDFLNVWGAPRVAAAHGAASLGDLKQYQPLLAEAFGHKLKDPFNWSYPPHALLLLAPVSAPPYLVGLALWTLAGVAAFSAAVAAGLPKADRGFSLAVALASPAALWCLLTGQNGLLIGAGLLAALLCLDRRPLIAGVLFGLLTVKPHLGVLIPVALVAMGAWRTIAAASLTALALAAVALLSFGVEPWRLWMTTTASYQLSLIDTIGDPTRYLASIHHYMMGSIAVSGYIAQLPPALTWSLQAAGAAFAAGAVWIAFRRDVGLPTRAFVLLSGAALATPYLFNYDFTALSGAVLWTMAAPVARRAERVALGLVFALPAALVPLHFVALPVAPLIIAGALMLTMRRVLAMEAARAEGGAPAAAPRLAEAR